MWNFNYKIIKSFMYPCVHNEVVMGQRGAMRDFLRVCKDMLISTICHAGDIIMYFIFLYSYNISYHRFLPEAHFLWIFNND